MSGFAGFTNGIVQTDITTGLVYGNGLTAPCSEVDYTTNIFNPTIAGSTTAGTTTYTTQSGTYTKIGKRVLFDITVVFTQTTGTGDLQVQSLPYVAASYDAYCTVATTNILWPNNQGTYIVATVLNGTSNITIGCYHNTQTPANLQMPTGSGTYTVMVSGSYQTAS